MERGEKRRPSSSEEANINCHSLAMGSLGQFGHVRRTAHVPHALGIRECTAEAHWLRTYHRGARQRAMWITDTTAPAAAVCDGGVARGHEENLVQHCCCLKLYFTSRGSDTGRSWLHSAAHSARAAAPGAWPRADTGNACVWGGRDIIRRGASGVSNERFLDEGPGTEQARAVGLRRVVSRRCRWQRRNSSSFFAVRTA
jgi:hypothetical protein